MEEVKRRIRFFEIYTDLCVYCSKPCVKADIICPKRKFKTVEAQ